MASLWIWQQIWPLVYKEWHFNVILVLLVYDFYDAAIMRAKRTAVFAAKRFRFWHPNVNLKYSSKVLSTRLRIFKIAI